MSPPDWTIPTVPIVSTASIIPTTPIVPIIRTVRSPSPRSRFNRQSGLTLVELLVVLAIIAALAGLIYPAIMNSIYKSEVALAAQRIDAIEKAKIQYMLDKSDYNSKSFDFSDIAPYLVQFGQAITKDKLNDGTGGKIEPGDFLNTAYYTPANEDQMKPYVNQYHVPTKQGPESMPTPSSGGSSGTSNP